jgi:hypothetical protein
MKTISSVCISPIRGRKGYVGTTRHPFYFQLSDGPRVIFAWRAGLPDFSWCMIPKPKKCTKLTHNVPNGHRISQMPVKYFQWPSNMSAFFNLRPSKICPNWDFWFENKPSGNPAEERKGRFNCNNKYSLPANAKRERAAKQKLISYLIPTFV